MILSQSVTKVVDELHFLLELEQSLVLEPDSWRMENSGEVSEHQPAQVVPRALG